MRDECEHLKIPNEFIDYRRRLIIQASKETMLVVFDDLFVELQKYGVLHTRMNFEIGEIAFRVVYIADERFTVAEVIADLQPDFAEFQFEGDARMGLAQAPPNDPLYPSQWALHTMEAPAAWERVAEVVAEGPPRSPVIVAVVDSGIKRNHEDLLGTSISGMRIIPPNWGTFLDDTGHGTMISGIIGATANNATGMAGEARNVQILAIKITDERMPPTALAAALGILAAVLSGARVINASWHVLENSNVLRLAILYAGALGRVVVVAAGNYGSNNTEIPTLPASHGFPVMVVAMASDRHDDKCWFSNYGGNVDLAAPGIGVESTGIYYINPRYPENHGTSVSAAHVSAAAALLLAIDNWAPNEIREHLNASADQFRSLQRICRSGGRLNLRRAVCGPFEITNPAGGALLAQGTMVNVQWMLHYTAPIVGTVEILFIDQATRLVLSSFPGRPNDGLQAVPAPGLVTEAFIRLRCDARNLYADSAAFYIV